MASEDANHDEVFLQVRQLLSITLPMPLPDTPGLDDDPGVLFDRLDTGKKGHLTVDQMIKGIRDLGYGVGKSDAELTALVDKNGDLEISRAEFKQYLS